jgi:hypothetical protein
LVVGRGPTSDVRLDDVHVSRTHAALRKRGGRVWVQDLGSSGGTFVNGQAVTGSHELHPGDVVSFATVHLRYVLDEMDGAETTTLTRQDTLGAAGRSSDTAPVRYDIGRQTAGSKKSDSPWYLRGRSVIVGMGALAAAVLAVVGLWDRLFPPDVEDVATITSVGVTRQMSLSEFTESFPGTDVSLNPAPAAAMALGVVGLTQIGQALPTGNATPTDTGTPPDTATPRDTATPTDSATPTDTTTPTVRTKSWPPTESYMNSVVDQPVLDDWLLPDDPGEVAYLMPPEPHDPNDPEGDPLPADEVAKRLAEALREVESEGKDGKKDPLGWVVAVNLEVGGLEDVPLLLTWSLDGLDVPVSWAADSVAYRVTATTAHDAGSVDVWVPDLEKPGTYNVNLKLAQESDGTILTQGQPVEVPNL